ncbi:MAG: hypothetical protein ABSC06_39830 [Rhodopila sp.]
MPSEAELLAALARSDADLAAGRVVAAAVVHAELAAAIARIAAAGATPHDRQAALIDYTDEALSRRPAARPA